MSSDFLRFFVVPKNNFQQSGTADGTAQTNLCIQRAKLLADEILVRIIYTNFIQLRKNNLFEKINFTIQKHFVINFSKNIEKH